MNSILNTMLKRSSCRSFIPDEKIPQDHLDLIMKATQQAPTYVSGQQYTVLAITDPALKEKMVELTMPSSGNPQKWISTCSVFLLFVMDFSKLEVVFDKSDKDFQITDYFESLLIGSVDVGIGAEATVVAAESLGYGTVMIGAVRKSSEVLIQAFDLPKKTFPIVGVCVGVNKSQEVVEPKPRLPLSSFVHKNKYQQQDWNGIIEVYDKTMHDYMIRIGKTPYIWTDLIKSYYGKGYHKELSSIYKQQGFDFR